VALGVNHDPRLWKKRFESGPIRLVELLAGNPQNLDSLGA
jgi:hypothetical protein